MATISFDIPDEKIDKVVDSLVNLFPIPLAEDKVTPLFTQNQWAKECVRRWIVTQVARWDQVKAQRLIPFNIDDSMVK
jgi:hypothetical protein